MLSPPPSDLFKYPARLHRVIDGDTMEVVLDLGFGITAKKTLRLLGVWMPEKNTAEGLLAKSEAQWWLNNAAGDLWPLVVQTCKPDNFGRALATVWQAGDAAKPTLNHHMNEWLNEREN